MYTLGRYTRLVSAGMLLIAATASAQSSPKSTQSSPKSKQGAAKAAQPVPKAEPKLLQARVWVNSLTKVYHCPGSMYYGTTRSGEFMEEAQARGHGYRAVLRNGCGNVASNPRAPLPDSTPATRRMVWVNTESNTYHCPNTPDWGATRRGRYAAESSAVASGIKPATGKACGLR